MCFFTIITITITITIMITVMIAMIISFLIRIFFLKIYIYMYIYIYIYIYCSFFNVVVRAPKLLRPGCIDLRPGFERREAGRLGFAGLLLPWDHH